MIKQVAEEDTKMAYWVMPRLGGGLVCRWISGMCLRVCEMADRGARVLIALTRMLHLAQMMLRLERRALVLAARVTPTARA